ncbi:MAG: alpha/beta fold hydrolase [Tepidiformaceae bacterium]
MELRIRYATTSDNVKIAFSAFGEGLPLVYTSNVWGDLQWYGHDPSSHNGVERLVQAGWRVIKYDGRGMGSSARDVRDFSLVARVEDLEAVINAAGADRFVLCGYGQGGPVAIAYAREHAGRVSHLVLANTFASGAAYYETIPAMRALTNLHSMALDQWEFFTDTMASATTGFHDAERARSTAQLFRSAMSAPDFLAYVAATRDIDVSDLLHGLTVPTMALADSSGLRTDALVRELAAAIPGAVLMRTADYVAALLEFVSGEAFESRTPKDVPPGPSTRTVLFTDIVGHTEMIQRLGDARGRDVLREHERITREMLKQHGGAEVKTMGDGFMASFGSVTKAIECAIALQRAFATHTESMPEPLHVRVGLNAGEPIEEDGDLFGATVILASRIAAKAGAGEILVPDTVRGLLSGKGFVFGDRGEFVPKGFDEGMRLWDVRWRG